MLFTKIKSKASALVYGLIIIGIVSIIFASLIEFVISHVRYSLRAQPREQAMHIAEAGVYFYRWHLAHNVEGKTEAQTQAFWAGNPIGVDDSDGSGGGSNGNCDDADASPDNYDADGDGDIDNNDSDGTEKYVSEYNDGTGDIGRYEICVTPPNKYSTIVTIKVTGWSHKRPNLKRTVQARLRKPSWSEYAIVANAPMRLSATTEVYGPMHVNGGFRFDGTAHNVVSSSVETYTNPDPGPEVEPPGVWAGDGSNHLIIDDSGNFLAGKKYPIPIVDFDDVVGSFSSMKVDAQANGLYWGRQGRGRLIELGVPLSNEMRITRVRGFHSGRYNIRRLANNSEVKIIPDEGVLYVKDNVWVKGTMPAGKHLTIVAHDESAGTEPRIFLGDGDIKYENYESNTVLGLAAEGDITFIRDSPDTLHIDAALLSQRGRVGWDFSDSHSECNPDSLCEKTKIELNGAISTNARMGFGYTDGSGFQNRTLIFDNNLLLTPPPLFPTGDSYSIDLWEEIK